MFPPLETYRDFIYRVGALSPHITHSTLILYTIGTATAVVTGQIEFTGDVVLVVAEALSFAPGHRCITRYGYEVWLGSEKLYWYDPQPHPDDPTLAATHPHHPSASSGQASTSRPTSNTTAFPPLTSVSSVPISLS